ncbi:hypothetical protein J3Q64DRAFT_1822302 [Phycomyces blakesleeanus]|uniref:Uncharacterized protein n=1 Tax=Phycomyces blakesleeanus TaxID=4837 RepID=A0ABR3AZ42_PHYBL
MAYILTPIFMKYLFLRKDQHDQALTNVIGFDNIQELHAELLNRYVSQDIKMEKSLFSESINIFRLPGNILIDEEVKEFELVTNHLDKILIPLFHDPEKKLMYIWLNKATEASGHHVAVYLCTLHDDGFYVVFEVGDIKVPKSILELPGFIMKLDGIKQLANLYEYSCARKDDETVISKPKILSPNNTEMSTIINTRITFFIR